MAGQPVEVWLNVTTTSGPTTLKSTLEIWTAVPEQLDGEASSAHAVVIPAPETAAAIVATAIALTVRPLRNIFWSFHAVAALANRTETAWTLLCDNPRNAAGRSRHDEMLALASAREGLLGSA